MSGVETDAGFPRRTFLRLAGAGLVAALVPACRPARPGTGPPPAPTGHPSLGDLGRGAERVELLPGRGSLATGGDLFTFGLLVPPNTFIQDGAPTVWEAVDREGPSLGPFPATWYRFTGYRLTHDRTPHTYLPGFYAAQVETPRSGRWDVAVVLDTGDRRGYGIGRIRVEDHPVAAVGTRATSVPTPVATTPQELAHICSREPPCPMHVISLDDALDSGRPTVLVFSAPLLCDSRMCGTVTDEVLLVRRGTPRGAANFVHVDIYPPPHTDETNPAEPFVDWGFTSDPWTIVIDGDGIIRGRFEGPVVAPLVSRALQPLLQAS